MNDDPAHAPEEGAFFVLILRVGERGSIFVDNERNCAFGRAERASRDFWFPPLKRWAKANSASLGSDETCFARNVSQCCRAEIIAMSPEDVVRLQKAEA